MVRLPCGSRSIRRTRKPRSPSATPRFSVVVVFATPPFWLANAMTFASAGPFVTLALMFGRGSIRESAIGPLFRGMLAQSSDGAARSFRHRRFGPRHRARRRPRRPSLPHRRLERLDRARGSPRGPALAPRPGLRLPHERPQLDEQGLRRDLLAAERLDAVEPFEHVSRLVHASNLPGQV